MVTGRWIKRGETGLALEAYYYYKGSNLDLSTTGIFSRSRRSGGVCDNSDVSQGCGANRAESLPGVSSPRRSGADVVADVSGNPAVGESDSQLGGERQDAAMAGRSALRKIRERSFACAGRARDAARLGRRPRARS